MKPVLEPYFFVIFQPFDVEVLLLLNDLVALNLLKDWSSPVEVEVLPVTEVEKCEGSHELCLRLAWDFRPDLLSISRHDCLVTCLSF